MRVLGYRFDQNTDAERARSQLVNRFRLPPDHARLAALAEDGLVLGVRVGEAELSDVKALLRENGGEPVVDVDEGWTGLKP